MYSLYIDSHDKELTLIIYKDNIIVEKLILNDFIHLSKIMITSIDEILNKAKITIHNISQIWVINGPGSFTSTRIGVTIAKTFAYCLNIPIKSVSYLELIASQIDDANKIVSIPEKNGFFLALYENSLLKNLFYLSKRDYINYQKEHIIYENLPLDYENIYYYFTKLQPTKPFDVNPIYIKSIGVLSDKKTEN